MCALSSGRKLTSISCMKKINSPFLFGLACALRRDYANQFRWDIFVSNRLQRNRNSPLSTNFRFSDHHHSSTARAFNMKKKTSIRNYVERHRKATKMGHRTKKKKEEEEEDPTNLWCEKVINYDGARAPIYSTFSMAPIRALSPSLLQSRTRAHHRPFHTPP